MDESLECMFQKSEEEWAEIDKLKAMREKKDRKIISIFCADNNPTDVFHTIELLNKYPEKITVPLLHKYFDIKDLYKKYLESGGEYDE